MSTEIVTRLKALKLHGMASNWPELVAHCRHAALEPEQLIKQLLDAEGAERNVRSIAYQMTAACWRRLKFDPPVRALPTQI